MVVDAGSPPWPVVGFVVGARDGTPSDGVDVVVVVVVVVGVAVVVVVVEAILEV